MARFHFRFYFFQCTFLRWPLSVKGSLLRPFPPPVGKPNEAEATLTLTLYYSDSWPPSTAWGADEEVHPRQEDDRRVSRWVRRVKNTGEKSNEDNKDY